MLTTTNIHRFLLLSLSLTCVTACGVDNSGGLPPEGEKFDHESVFFESALSCGLFDERAFLLRDDADVDDFKADCPELLAAAETELRSEVTGLVTDETLVITLVAVGGCIGDTAIMGVYLDDDVAHVHVLKSDSSYGQPDAACPADLGELVDIGRVTGISAATSADVVVGVFNSDLPNAPALPGG